MSQYKYVNRTDAEITVGDYTIPARGGVVLAATYALLDAEEGVLVDKYVDGVQVQTEYTPNYLTGPVGIGVAANAGAQLSLAASTTAVCSVNIAPGVAPSSPNNGDMWTTSAGLFVRVNGATKSVTFNV